MYSQINIRPNAYLLFQVSGREQTSRVSRETGLSCAASDQVIAQLENQGADHH